MSARIEQLYDRRARLTGKIAEIDEEIAAAERLAEQARAAKAEAKLAELDRLEAKAEAARARAEAARARTEERHAERAAARARRALLAEETERRKLEERREARRQAEAEAVERVEVLVALAARVASAHYQTEISAAALVRTGGTARMDVARAVALHLAVDEKIAMGLVAKAMGRAPSSVTQRLARPLSMDAAAMLRKARLELKAVRS